MSSAADRVRFWRLVTLVALFGGYTGYYVCRSNLSVCGPLLQQEFPQLDDKTFGDIASLGVLLYALGKVFNGVLADRLGGKVVFVGGMLLSVSAVYAFSRSAPLTGFFVAWAVNRFVQSMGWGGLVRIAARWFPPERLGTMLGILSMSYLLGDALARLYLSEFIAAGAGWREVFEVSAITLTGIAIIVCLVLRESPIARGLPEPAASAEALFQGVEGRLPVRKLLGTLLGSRMFWLVCGLNFGLTLIRETFNLWTPIYLKSAVGLTSAEAAQASFVFPFVGAIASIVCGLLVDRVRGGAGRVMTCSVFGAAVILLITACVPPEGRAWLAILLIGLSGAFLLGPYTLCSGALAVKLGGKQASATAAGWIDGVGYLGAVLSGSGIGRIAQAHGWSAAFATLAGVAICTAALGYVYLREHHRERTV